MKITTIFLLLLSTVFFSCKQSAKQKIIGKWHAVKLENPGMDSFFAGSQAYIDTIGKNNDPATNMALYGATNMDSMRQILQQQFDSAKTMQYNAVINTTFNFRNNGTVILAFSGSMDSSKWHINNEKEVILTQLNKQDGNPNDSVTMHLLAISDTVLKLQFDENNSPSTVTFRREGK